MQVERLASFFMELMEYFKSPTAFRSPTEMIFYIEDKSGNSQGIPAPVIDFANTMVLGVFLGMRPNTCYSVAIESVEQIAGQRLTVKYRETKPTGSAVCGQAITYPSHLVSVPASELSVEFVELQ